MAHPVTPSRWPSTHQPSRTLQFNPPFIAAFIPLVPLAGCASNSEMKRPFVFKEAKLPAGFPAPT